MGHGTKTNGFVMRTKGGRDVGQSTEYFIVETQAMPEIIQKVVQAKRLLETGRASTVNAAAQAVGISRSAFYKYKDAVRPFNDMLHGRIVTLQVVLRHEPGALSALLNVFAGTGANILTINQNLPVDGHAVVTITAETSGLLQPLNRLLDDAREAPGVLKCELLAG